MKAEYLAYLSVGLILGAVSYIAVGTLWLVNFWAQNILAGMA